MTGPFADHALAYRRADLSVIPTVGENGKRPAIRGFMRYARHHAAERTVERWAEDFPSANIGIMCGPVSGLTVIDIDDADLIGQAVVEFGETPLISRGRRGFHLYYRHHGERSLNRLNGAAIDVRGARGNPLIIAPPSIRPATGDRWEWERGCLPDDLDKLPAVKLGSLPVVEIDTLATITTANDIRSIGPLDGMRSDWLLGESLRAARRCATFDALLNKTRELNTRCKTPLSDDEVVSTSRSAWNYQITGKNRVGQGGYAQITAHELEALGGNADSVLLLMRLRAAHACRTNEFALTPALGISLGWTDRRFRIAREFLSRERFIERTNKGGRGAGDPARYRLK